MAVYRSPDTITLDVHAQSIKTPVFFVTGDVNAYPLLFKIVDGGVNKYDLTGKTVAIVCKVPNSATPIVDSLTVTDPLEGLCSYTVKNSIYAQAGEIQAELHIFDGDNNRLSTCTFYMTVRQGIDDSSGIPASDSYPILVQLISEVQGIKELINIDRHPNNLDDITAPGKYIGHYVQEADEANGIYAEEYWYILFVSRHTSSTIQVWIPYDPEYDWGGWWETWGCDTDLTLQVITLDSTTQSRYLDNFGTGYWTSWSSPATTDELYSQISSITNAKGQPFGYCDLDGTGKVPSNRLPAAAIDRDANWRDSGGSLFMPNPPYWAGAGNYCHADSYGRICAGSNNHAAAMGSVYGNFGVAHGRQATAQADYSAAEGAFTAANGQYSHAGGSYTVADGMYSFAHGAYVKAPRKSQLAYGYGMVSSYSYKANGAILTLMAITADETPKEMTIDGAAFNNDVTEAGSNKFILTNNRVYAVRAQIVAKSTDGQYAGFEISAAVKRDNGAATTAVLGTPAKTVLYRTTAAIDASLQADATNGALQVMVTGLAAKTFKWYATLQWSEIEA